MPDLGNVLNSSSSLPCSRFKPLADPSDSSNPSPYVVPIKPLENDRCRWGDGLQSFALHVPDLKRNRHKLFRQVHTKKSLDGLVDDWVSKTIRLDVHQRKCFSPFLIGSSRMADCRACLKLIKTEEQVFCSVRGCQGVYHLDCVKEKPGFSTLKQFKCPQHACFLCKKAFNLWKCIRCQIACHDKCAAFPEHVVHFHDQPGRALCWRHPKDWCMEEKCATSTNGMKEIFCRLPLPYVEEDFKFDITWKDVMEKKMDPPSYVHIKRNVYLIKKKREDVGAGIGCTNCDSICSVDCVCRVQSISCSKACRCSEICTNRPFRKEKRIKIVKTEHCGWGVVAAEPINKDDFVIEYIGEVINDATCEQRLWDMKYKGVQNFYLCEIRKDFTIDATFKGNSSRFLNHSCSPNCKLEKWQVEGEIRVGVFAARYIDIGEPLTYDYRFVQFGREVKCHCGAANCHGYIGTKRKNGNVKISWGVKRKRTSSGCLAIVKL